MDTSLSPWNWSFKKAFSRLTDNFAKAQARILLVIVAFSMVKCLVVLYYSAMAGQQLQFTRALVMLAAYIILLKIFLSRPSSVPLFTHLLLVIGLLVIWTNFLFYTHQITIPILQFMFMVVVCSFYILGSRMGFIYSLIATLPIIATEILKDLPTVKESELLGSAAINLVVILNMFTIIGTHYFIYKAFRQNMDEKEQLNKQLEQHAIEATRLAAARTAFASTMSHELRTPLYSVIGITELLMKDVKDKAQRENLNILRYSASDLLSLVNNILDINKLDSNKTELEQTSFNLFELVKNVCSVLQLKANEKQLQLHLQADESLQALEVTSDPTRLTQVMYNLVGNAIKFTDEGSVTVDLRLVQQTPADATIAFTVTDTGIGISPEKQQEIFEPFTQASKDTKRIYGGTGLGLTIVKEILSLLGTTIHLHSEPGKGTSFDFILSLPKSAAHDEKNAAASKSIDISGLRILVAEDNQVNQLILQKQLETLNLRAIMVNNGREAFDMIAQQDFDAVLLDLDMPEMDGYETVTRIREHRKAEQPTAHLIAFTASVYNQQQILSSGFDDYLYKPVELKALRASLEKAVSRKMS